MISSSSSSFTLPFLMADKSLYLPVANFHKYITTSTDVIHSFCLPHFHIKLDSIPGVLNAHYFLPLTTGYFFGQCSELCGIDHSFMPINVVIVNYNNYLN